MGSRADNVYDDAFVCSQNNDCGNRADHIDGNILVPGRFGVPALVYRAEYTGRLHPGYGSTRTNADHWPHEPCDRA